MNTTSQNRVIKIPNLTQQSLWEGGRSLHTEMLEVTHIKTLRFEVTPCIKEGR